MRCSKARRLISDYMDDTLKTKDRLLLESHLEVCSDCKLLLADFQGIIKDAKELETPSPSDKAWLEILARLNRAKQEAETPKLQIREWLNFVFAKPKVKYALSAFLVLAVIIGGLIFGLLQLRGKEFLGRGELESLSLAKLNEAEHYCQLAIEALNEVISAQKGSLDPQVAEVFSKNLKVIDSSIEACHQALQQDPQNLIARSYLLAAYREKIAFLNEIVEVKKQSPPKKGMETT